MFLDVWLCFLGAQATRAPLSLWFFRGRIGGGVISFLSTCCLQLAALRSRESFGIFYNIFGKFLESFGIFWNLLGSFGFFCNLLECFGIFWNLLETFEIFWNLYESLWIFGIFWNLMESFEQLGRPRTWELLRSSWSILGALGLESISSLV